MIRDFVQWTATFVETSNLDQLSGCRIGIEAAEYLSQRILNHTLAKEPLVPALGGLPLAFTQHIEADLDAFRNFDIEPLFVFSGLDITKQDNPFGHKAKEAAVNADAWIVYDNHQAEQSVAKFGESTYVTPEYLFRALQSILVKRNVRFQVAPFSAWAQLAYLERSNNVHAISGASDILLFECDKVIISWQFEEKHFRFIRRQQCVADLEKFAGNVRLSNDEFIDACMLAGNPFLPTLPNLTNRTDLLKPHNAIKMIMNNGVRTGHAVVVNNQDDPRCQELGYKSRFQKARLAVRNHPVYTVDGKIEPQNSHELPNDAVAYLGQRLPDELFHYMSRGLIDPRILQWRTTCEIYEVPPLDGGDSADYKALVSSKLVPLRTTAINLLSSMLHNWYRHKDLEQKCWFPDSNKHPLTSVPIRVERPSESQTPAIVDTWNVKEATFRAAVGKHEGSGYLGSAILALEDPDFTAKTIAKKDPKNVLSSTDEILYNSIWRFLALRDYVDSNHNLKDWGKVLAKVIGGVKGKPELEEAAVLAVELLRLDLLTPDINMFPSYNGAPMRGSTKDQNSNMLVSRVAGLGTLRHRPIGFTGPLSQHLLGYNSIINAVRQTLRDLVEVASTHMFMTGSCNRHADLSDIAIKLPFLLPNNCALSIAVKSYLDELLSNDADPTSVDTKTRVLDIVSTKFFPQSEDFSGDLLAAFELWDGITQGVKNGGNAVPEAMKNLWSETNEWLAARR